MQTSGGVFHVRWELDARASAQGGLVHFSQFLHTEGAFHAWMKDCPLQYESSRVHGLRGLGTWLLSAPNGYRRYTHYTALRGNGVNLAVQGMRRVVREDAMLRAVQRFDCEVAQCWLNGT